MWCGKHLRGDHQPAPIGPKVRMKEIDRHTHTETVLQGNKKTLRNGETSALSWN